MSNPNPQTDNSVLSAVRPDEWGAHGPNQTVTINDLLTQRNNYIYRGHTFSGVTKPRGGIKPDGPA